MSASHPSLWDSTKKTIKAVIGRDTLGTGVTIVGKGLILAAYHTLSNQEGCDHVQFVFWKPGESSRSYPCRKIISSDPENDYTLAETEGDPSEFYPVAQIDPRPLSPEELGREKWTIVTTHSVSSRKVRRCGFYNPQLDPHSPSFLRPLPPDAPAPNYVAVSCDAPDAVVVGDSGSAVFDQSGSLAGQLSYQLNHDPSKGRFRADKVESTACPIKPSKMVGQHECELTEPRMFNLMFKTFMGPIEDSASVVYLRPETAQGIYVNFLNVQQSARKKLPFGIAQIGKAFRNEITPGNFIFRTREFEQMEMQYFVKPGTDMEWFEKWKAMRQQWHLDMGFRKKKLRFHQHTAQELAHYARAAFDIQYEFPFGWQEIEGIHNRGDFDLGRHQQFSGKKLEYFDEETKERYVPYVVETSVGCDRSLLVALVDAYRFDGERVWLALHPTLAPYKVGIFPLMKKPDLMEFTDKVFADVKKRFRATTDDAGSIGKRYRRQDEIGTPFGVTIDYETLSTSTVTVRHRDSMEQERIPAEKLVRYLEEKIENWGK